MANPSSSKAKVRAVAPVACLQLRIEDVLRKDPPAPTDAKRGSGA